MKVLLTTDVGFPVSRLLKHAGIHRVVYVLAKELQGLGVDVTVACAGDSDELGGARYVTVERALHGRRLVESTPVDPPSMRQELRQETMLANPLYTVEDERHFRLTLEHVLSEGFDLVHDHGGGLLLSDAYRHYEGVLSLPILTTLHGALYADAHLEECAVYRQRTASNTFFSCVSRHQGQLWEQQLDINAVVYNGIFVDDYRLEREKKGYVFNIGRIMSRKGQDIAVEVAQRAGLKLVLAGPIVEPEYFDQFRSSVGLMPHIGRIPVTPSYLEEVVESVLARPEPAIYIGQLDDRQKGEWFGHADCFLMPIRWDEPFGLVLIEAMACGTPVVAFNRGAIAEILVDKKTGFLVDSLDEMVAAVSKVGQIDPLDCRRHVEQHFGSRVMALKYLELYQRLLNSTRSV